MSWNPLDMYSVGNFLYGYVKQEHAILGDRKRVVFFKITSKQDNKLALSRMTNKTTKLDCKVPDKETGEQLYNVTINKNSGVVKIRYKNQNVELKRWDGEPKFSN